MSQKNQQRIFHKLQILLCKQLKTKNHSLMLSETQHYRL